MIEIDGEQYQLQEGFTIDPNDVDTRWRQDWGEEDTYEIDVAQKEIRVVKCFVLVKKGQS